MADVAVPDPVENKELPLRSEEGRVRNTGALQMRFGFFGDAARVAVIRLTRDRVDDGANQAERWFGVKNINPGRARIGNDEHVAGIDRAPAADTGAVEPEAIGENFLVIFGERGGEMLPGTRQIGEFEIYELHVVVLDHFADVSWRFVFVFGHGEEFTTVTSLRRL